MRTDDLINILSTNVETVDRWKLVREIGFAVLAGIAAVIAISTMSSGMRADIGNAKALTFLCIKLAFSTAIVIAGTIFLIRLARPGSTSASRAAALSWLPVPVAALAGVSLVSAPLWHWQSMAASEGWLACLISIPLIALVPFAAVIWTVRRMAPTDLMRAGALAGFAAGGISAMGYAWHCTDDSLPFIGIWYGGAVLMCTLAGAMLGPRLLRW